MQLFPHSAAWRLSLSVQFSHVQFPGSVILWVIALKKYNYPLKIQMFNIPGQYDFLYSNIALSLAISYFSKLKNCVLTPYRQPQYMYYWELTNVLLSILPKFGADNHPIECERKNKHMCICTELVTIDLFIICILCAKVENNSNLVSIGKVPCYIES